MQNESPTAVPALDGDPEANSAFGSPPPPPTPPPPADTTAFGAQPRAETYVPEPLTPKRPKEALKTWLAGGLAAAVFGIGGFFGIQAATHHSHATTTAGAPGGGPGFAGGGRGTLGTITAIGGSTLTLSSRDGSTATITTSSSTTVTKATAGSLSGIKTGDRVIVRATSGADGVTAAGITDTGGAAGTTGPDGPPGGGTFVTGTVVAVDPSGTLTVAQAGGTTVTVKTSTTTSVTFVQSSTVSALALGDTVRVIGTATDSTVAAASIEAGVTALGPDGGGPGGPGGPGGGPGFGGPPAA